MSQTDPEIEWIRKSQEGDHEAYEALINQHQRMIHSLAYRMTGSMAEAEDLAQETFIRAYHQIGKFRSESLFSSWLYRIAVNACLNWKKARERCDQAHEEWAIQRDSPREGEDMSVRVQEALMKLNPKQRAAVVLTTYDGLNHAEAARVFGCSESTVSWRIFAARRKLRRILTRVSP